jgi:hypothetical protein
MRTTVLLLLLLMSVAASGCAAGFRLGGNRFGAGIGGYLGPVPDVVKPEAAPDHSYYPPSPRLGPPVESR